MSSSRDKGLKAKLDMDTIAKCHVYNAAYLVNQINDRLTVSLIPVFGSLK